MTRALTSLYRAAWRMKRAQTDPDFAVVLDALLEGADADRVREVTAATGGRVVVERPGDPDELTAVVFDIASGQVQWVANKVGDIMRAVGAPVLCVLPAGRRGDGGFDFEQRVRPDRAGTATYVELYDGRGELLMSWNLGPSAELDTSGTFSLQPVTTTIWGTLL